MEDKEIMYFKDENGDKVAFEAVAHIFLNEDTEDEKEYMILAPVEGGNEDDAFVFRVDYIEENKELNLVEDDKEFEEVKKEYKDLLYNK
ncbi:DUF1292 domain-containing protein [Clostridium hydrogeniformans]|uniref:DUF1292 domain-containing protein n=1 Tax=Clostridium hydrogeniformans TaxID=349933 RepID=UPI000486615F|nr:DUF1292 domain-containing protein [Clostridium hydrogeniformans]